jgi:hypothetical protein
MHLPDMQTGDIVGNWLRRSPLQPDPKMPCPRCAARAWCRGNCLKNLCRADVGEDAAWREKMTDPIRERVRRLGREIDRHDATAWFEQLPLPQHRLLLDCEVYPHVEVMPRGAGCAWTAVLGVLLLACH